MSRRRRATVLTGIATMCGVGALLMVLTNGGSAATAQDRLATNSYLTERQALIAHVAGSRDERESAIEAYVARIVTSCPGILKGAPPITGKQRFYVRKGSTLVLAPRSLLFSDATAGVERAMLPAETVATREFTHQVRGLHWADSVFTKLVHTFADVEGARLEREAPDLCRDARAWAASGYKIIAARTSHTAERLAATREVLMQELADRGCTGPYPGRAVLHVLGQTMSRDQRRTAEDLSRLEAQLDARNAEVVQTAVMQIEKALGSRLFLKNGKSHPVGIVPSCVAVPRTAPR